MRPPVAGILVLAVLALVCLAGNASTADVDSLDVDLGPIADFSLTDQNGRTVTRKDLLGKVWVASFIFTRCPKECVAITQNLGELQRELRGEEKVVLVSFTVDPDHDTCEVLKAYAAAKGADAKHWLFLTGRRSSLDRLIVDSFRQGIRREDPSDGRTAYQIGHSSRLVVVDPQGRFSGYIDGTKRESVSRVLEKIHRLIHANDLGRAPAERSWLPEINASLNSLSGLLLVLGFIAIRRRQVGAHKAFMVAALISSFVFLVCYLYYHFAILEGRPTGFPGEGWIRPVYFAVLISHTVLAAVVAPLAVIVAYRGVRGQLARHVLLARWTLPAWLYVSVTGVLVYWMRYQLYP